MFALKGHRTESSSRGRALLGHLGREGCPRGWQAGEVGNKSQGCRGGAAGVLASGGGWEPRWESHGVFRDPCSCDLQATPGLELQGAPGLSVD